MFGCFIFEWCKLYLNISLSNRFYLRVFSSFAKCSQPFLIHHRTHIRLPHSANEILKCLCVFLFLFNNHMWTSKCYQIFSFIWINWTVVLPNWEMESIACVFSGFASKSTSEDEISVHSVWPLFDFMGDSAQAWKQLPPDDFRMKH